MTVTDDLIHADSLKLEDMVDQRASQVWIYYGQKNPTVDLEEKKNYHSRIAVVDEDAQSTSEHGTAAIREIFSRWIPQFGRTLADTIGTRILSMFRDPPLRADFEMRFGPGADNSGKPWRNRARLHFSSPGPSSRHGPFHDRDNLSRNAREWR